MTRMTSELVPISKLPHHTCGRTFGPYIWFDLQQAHIQGGSSVESGLNLETSGPLISEGNKHQQIEKHGTCTKRVLSNRRHCLLQKKEQNR
ncbi:hypothetical protein AVEN_125604-1 [Araneus ventricosus]|uniref:Uncharacterized protein n=1 Tax=Araneus ventricosus TaxID=182803 RepID=A0A4Y2R103_ARAVE|nr:hypothetical protein AVEN_125604-1 [Araneus ventricosus]